MGSAGTKSGSATPAQDAILPYKGKQVLVRVGPIAALLLIIIGFYWKITLTYEFDWAWGPDIADQVLPWFEEEARQVRHSHLPLWDPHSWAGQPMLGQGQPGAVYPLNWLLFLTPRTNGHIDMQWLQWYYVAIHCMAALFCYLLCRDLALSRFASVAGGVVFALGSYMGSVQWPQMINGAVWTPLVFMFLLRVMRGYRPLASAALCGLFWGMSWLSGHHQVPLFISLAAGFTWAYFAVQERSWKIAGLGVMATGFMFCTAAIQLLPAQEYGKLAKRWVSAPEPVEWNQPVPYLVHQMFSFSPLHAFAIVLPGLGVEVNPFIGIVAFSLAIVAVAAAWRRAEVKLFAALAIGAFAYALGVHNVFQGMLYALVPMVEKARSPFMATAIFGFGAAMLVAFGIEELRIQRAEAWGRRAGWILMGGALLLCVVDLCIYAAKSWTIPGDDRFAMAAIAGIGAGALMLGWWRGAVSNRAAGALALAIMLIELGNVSGYTFADRNDSNRMAWLHGIWKNQDIAQFLNAQPKPMRVDVENDVIPANWPEYYGLDTVRTALASITVNETIPESWAAPTRSLFNVRYTVGRTSTLPDARVVFEGEGGIKVFENPHAFPRAWAVHELVPISTIGQGYDLIRDHLDQMRVKAFEWPASGLRLTPCSQPDNVSVTRYTATHVTIRAEMGCDGMVVLSDTFYPGWIATVDQKQTAVHQLNFAMRGLLVPHGTHEIQYRYRPASVIAGGVLSVLGILGACLLAFFYRERRSPIDLSGKSRNNQE